MAVWTTTFLNFLTDDESGATAIEYGLIAAATGLAVASVMPDLSAKMTAIYDAILGYFATAGV